MVMSAELRAASKARLRKKPSSEEMTEFVDLADRGLEEEPVQVQQ